MKLGAIAIAGLVAACVHPIDPGLRATTPPVPAAAMGVERHDEPITGKGGVALYGRSWRPASFTEVHGVVVIQHGLKDHGDRYDDFAARLAHAGYIVYAVDLRGHGRSAGKRVVVDHFQDYVDDLETFIERVRTQEAGQPIVVFGHSMGGTIVVRWAEEHPDGAAGIVLSAPALGLDLPALKVALARFSAMATPSAGLLKLPESDFSRVPAVVEAMGKDPLISHPDGPARTAGQLLAGIEAAWADADHLTMPVLILHGTGDLVTAPAASALWIDRIPSSDKRLDLFEGASHVLLDDTAGDHVERSALVWIKQHTNTPLSEGEQHMTFADVAVPGRLRGERRLSMTAELGVRVDALDGDAQTSGQIRTRMAFAAGTLRWQGGLDLRAGYDTGAHVGVDLWPLGLALREGGVVLGVTAGAGLGGERKLGDLRGVVEATIDAALGPVHGFARGQESLLLNDKVAGARSTAWSAVVGVRASRDHRYWGRMRAGAGPFVAGIYGQGIGWGAMIGFAALGWQ